MKNVENKKIDLKIDLESKILRDINLTVKEFDKSFQEFDLSYQELISYFLRLDLKNTLGKTEFDDEIELVSTKKDGIYISTIYDSNYKINYRPNGSVDFYRINKNEKGEVDVNDIKLLFSLTLGPDVITNTIVIPKGIVSPELSGNKNFEVKAQYEVNIPDKTFIYSCREDSNEVCFKASLSGYNTRLSSFEMLCYEREIPPVEKEDKIRKKIARIFSNTKRIESGEGVICIPTSPSLTDLIDYADVIFDDLKKEAAKVIKKEDSNYGKYLRAISEEI